MAPPTPPRLTADLAVLFDDEEQLAACRRDFLARGALMVAPEGELQPLSTLTVTARGAALGPAVEVTCQVVSLQPGRALLQIAGDVPAALLGDAELAKPINPFAAPAPVGGLPPVDAQPHNPFATPKPVGDAAPAEPPNNPFAKPAVAPLDAPPAQAAKPNNPFAAPTPKAPEPNASSSAAVVPSLVRGGLLRFANRADLERAADALRLHGVVMAKPADDDAAQPTMRLALGTSIDADAIEASVQPHPSGAVLVRFGEVDGVASAVDRLLAAAPAAAPAPVVPPAVAPEAPTMVEDPPAIVEPEATVDETPAPMADEPEPAPAAPSPVAAPMSNAIEWEDSTGLGDMMMPPPSATGPGAAPSPALPDDVPLAAPETAAPDGQPSADDEDPPAGPAQAEPAGAEDPEDPEAPENPENPEDPEQASTANDDDGGDEAVLEGDTLRLPGEAAIARLKSDLDTLGAAQVAATDPKHLPERIEVVVAGRSPLGPFEVQALPAGDAMVLQPMDAQALVAALDLPPDADAVGDTQQAEASADAPMPTEDATEGPGTVDETPAAVEAAPKETSFAAPPAPPPTLEGETLTFASLSDLLGARKDLREVGALLARCAHPEAGVQNLTVAIEGGGDAGRHKASLQPMGGDQVLVQLTAPGALVEAADKLANADAARAAEAKRDPRPPTLEGGVLRFDAPLDLDHAAGDLIQHGATMASCAAPSSVGPTLTVTLAIGDGRGPDQLEATLQPAGPDQVVVQFGDRAALPEALGRVPRTSKRSGSSGSGKDFALSGPYVVPTAAAAILSIPLVRAPTDDEVERPTLPLLIRGLSTRPGSWRLTAEPEGHAPAFVVLQDQKQALGPKPLGDLGRALAKGSGRYTVTPLEENNPLVYKASLLGLMAELLRGIISNFDYDALQDGLGEKGVMAPVLNERGDKLLSSLQLTGGQERLAKRRMDGKTRVDQVVSGPAGQRAGWEAVYLLETFGCLAWEAASVGKDGKATVRLTAAELALADLADKDHFTRLGLHWSCAPRKIKPAYEEARDQFKAGSPAAKEDPTNARKMFDLVEEAYATLSDTGKRKTYRKESFTLVWSQQADLMVSHAKLALYRGDAEEARDTLEGIADFYRHPEASGLLKKLREMIEGG